MYAERITLKIMTLILGDIVFVSGMYIHIEDIKEHSKKASDHYIGFYSDGSHKTDSPADTQGTC